VHVLGPANAAMLQGLIENQLKSRDDIEAIKDRFAELVKKLTHVLGNPAVDSFLA